MILITYAQYVNNKTKYVTNNNKHKTLPHHSLVHHDNPLSSHLLTERISSHIGSDANKNLNVKAKARTKDLTLEAEDRSGSRT